MKPRQQTAQDKYPRFLDDQRQFFDELITQEWDSYQDPLWDLTRDFELDLLFRYVAPSRILNVGCGCGGHDVLMVEKPGVAEVVGIDYSEKSIETAERAYGHPKVRRLVADIRTMPAGEFDLAVSFQVIEHLRDAGEFLDACARQVVPGGWVAVATPNRLRLSNRLRTLLGRRPVLSDPQHYREYRPRELRAIGESVGLEHIATFGYGMVLHMPRTGRRVIPFALGLRLGAWIPELAQCFCVIFRKGG